MTPIFFPECYETLRITQQCPFDFQNAVEFDGLRNNASFRLPEGHGTLRIT